MEDTRVDEGGGEDSIVDEVGGVETVADEGGADSVLEIDDVWNDSVVEVNEGGTDTEAELDDVTGEGEGFSSSTTSFFLIGRGTGARTGADRLGDALPLLFGGQLLPTLALEFAAWLLTAAVLGFKAGATLI